jgi:hypothetical protein
MRFWWPIILFFVLQGLFAQTNSLRCRWIKNSVDSSGVLLDSLTVLPSSINTSGTPHLYNSRTGKIKFLTNSDSVYLCYRVFPHSLTTPMYKRNAAAYDSSQNYIEDYARNYQYVEKREELFASPGIQKNGNISRGISFGNNQNVFVNSSLNLQLEGKLTEDISITAVISDQNIPFQPDGNTQQLQEFDKVYVQLKSKRTSLIAGDLVMKNQPSEFLRFNRNVQGGLAEVMIRDSVSQFYSAAGAAISKGKFNSMLFGYGGGDTLIEGVQGPYRLRGPNNERFIIVLANSEKVYLDGRLLKRGWEYDYIIDYNQSEITFTNNVLITRFSRVRVDFEFSDRNYSRLISTFSVYEKHKRVQGFVNYYIEKDNPNNPLFRDLSQSEINSLGTIGDTLSKAFVDGVDSTGFIQNRILYKKVQSVPIDYYEYSVNPDSAFFEIKFSQVNIGAGSYVLESSTVNGRVFRYVGFPNGNYEPVQIIPLPKRKQMITMGAAFDISSKSQIFSEIAFSQNDVNLYSSLDAFDDKGWAVKGGYRIKDQKVVKKYNLSSSLTYEFNDRNFSAIDRFRAADFERFWNESEMMSDNNILEGVILLKKDEQNKLGYKITERIKPGDVNGQQQEAQIYKEIKRVNIQLDGFKMNNNRSSGSAEWTRYSGNFFIRSKFLMPGYKYTTEQNTVRDSIGNVSSSLMYYTEQRAYIKNGDSTRIKYLVEYAERTDKEVGNGEFMPNSTAKTVNSMLSGTVKQQQLTAGVSYRYLDNDQGPSPLANEETVMGRMEWSGQLLDRHIRSELLLVSATGRELKREFNYIPVPVGQGTHVWNDFNGDNIQQLDEFSEKKFDDVNGEFIKVFVPTDSYIRAYTNTLNYQVDVSAPRKWRGSESKFKNLISKFSNVTSLNTTKKITDPDFANRFNPFSNRIAEIDIISMQNTLRNTLFFNRSNPKFGWDINYNYAENKQYLAQGFESRYMTETGCLIRLNLNKFLSTKNSASLISKRNSSDFLLTRNYLIEGYKINPTFSWQPNRSFRLTSLLGYVSKSNTISYQNVVINEIGGELKMNKLSHRSFQSTIKYIYIRSNLTINDINSPLGFEMLEALRPGENMTWNFNWQEKLTNGLQLTFSYEGRKSKLVPAVHIGRMQVSALF